MTHDKDHPAGAAAMDLTGRVAVISGAASEIGRATARALAAAGAKLALGDIQADALADCEAELSDAGAEVASLEVDVVKRGQVDALAALALSRFGRVDVMANLAGVICDSLVAETREEDLDRVLAVNVKGVYFGCQAALSAMSGGPSCSIINMASAAGFSAIPKLSCYSISKAGVVALTRVLAAEVGPRGIRVNAIAPGFVEGGMTLRHIRNADGSVDADKREAVLEQSRRRNPLRITGVPADIANAVLFLACDASRYMTGQVLHPNGGSYMP